MAPGSRTPPFPAPGRGHAVAARPGPSRAHRELARRAARAGGLRRDWRARAGGPGVREGPGAACSPSGRRNPSAAILPPPRHPPLQVSVPGETCLPHKFQLRPAGAASGQDPGKLRSSETIAGMPPPELLFGEQPRGRMGVREGIWKAWKCGRPGKVLQDSLGAPGAR